MSSQFSASSTPTSGTIESLEKLEATPQGRRDRWGDEITFAEKELREFHESARRVDKRFIDDRDAVETNQKWINIFNTNVGILEASLYAHIPRRDVSRRFADMNDDVARVGSIILQRCIEQDMAEPSCDFDQVMRQTVSDRLIPGLGTAWLRLETETEDQPGSPTRTVVCRFPPTRKAIPCSTSSIRRPASTTSIGRTSSSRPAASGPNVAGSPAACRWIGTSWSSGSVKTSASASRSTTSRRATSCRTPRPRATCCQAGLHLRDLGSREA